MFATAIITIRIYIPLGDFFKLLPSHIEALYPDGLEIKILNGTVLTNVQEPYKIPFAPVQLLIDEYNERVLGTQAKPENLLVIDTNATSTDLESYSTYSLLTRDMLIYRNNKNVVKKVSLQSINNVTIDQRTVTHLSQVFSPVHRIIVPILILGTLILFALFLPLFGLGMLLFYTTILFGIAYLMKIHIPFMKLYQMLLHLVTIPVTLMGILSIVGLNQSFPLRDTLIITLLGTFLLYKIKPLLHS